MSTLDTLCAFAQEHDDDAALEEALRAATASKQAVANKVQEFKQQQQLAQLIQAVSRRLGFDETTLVDILQSHGMLTWWIILLMGVEILVAS